MIIPRSSNSLTVYADIVLPVLDMIQPKRICEVGSSGGEHSNLLSIFLKKYSGELILIDPAPRKDYSEWMNVTNNTRFIKDLSLNAIPQVDPTDVWFVDGDHNWYSVYHELHLINKLAHENRLPPIIYLHDVGWPHGRRDMYFDPSNIPSEFVHPHSRDAGIAHPNFPRPVLKGQYWALHEGGPRNGVLTAVEDFIASTTTSYYWIFIPAFLGLGILVHADHPLAAQIVRFYQPYHNNPFIAKMEKDRFDNYLVGVMWHHDFAALATEMNNREMTRK